MSSYKLKPKATTSAGISVSNTTSNHSDTLLYTTEDIRKWITELEWEGEDAINLKFLNLLVAVVQGIHASGLLKEKFGREIPVLIHELEYHEKISQQNIEANGETLNRDFVSFCMSCLPKVPNEMPKAETPVTAPQSHPHHSNSVCQRS